MKDYSSKILRLLVGRKEDQMRQQTGNLEANVPHKVAKYISDHMPAVYSEFKTSFIPNVVISLGLP